MISDSYIHIKKYPREAHTHSRPVQHANRKGDEHANHRKGHGQQHADVAKPLANLCPTRTYFRHAHPPGKVRPANYISPALLEPRFLPWCALRPYALCSCRSAGE